MGEVWRATHPRLETPLAVKVLKPGLLSDDRVYRAFRSEVRAIAQLDHPGIVQVFEHGLVDAGSGLASAGRLTPGSPFIVMEQVRGGTLRQLLARGSWGGTRRVLLDILDALSHAHGRGLIHRDLKMSNVLLRDEGICLTDFGLAQLPNRNSQGSFDSQREGTPAYMAPEQFEGRWRDYGPWTDLYALGCLACCLVTGKLPFHSENSLAGLMRAHLYRHPPPITPRFEVPDGLETWLRTLLRKRHHHRFPSAADAAWALRELQLMEPTSTGRLDLTVVQEASLLQPGPDTTAMLSDETVLTDHTVSSATLSVGEDTSRHAAPEPSSTSLTPSSAPPMPTDWSHGPGRRARRAPWGAGLSLYGLRPIPITGREEEQEKLWAALSRVRQSGRAHCIALRGSSGTGKSRLARWLCRRAVELGAAHPLEARHGPQVGLHDGLSGALSAHFRVQGLSRRELGAALELELASRPTGAASGDALGLTELLAPLAEQELASGPILRFGSPGEVHALLGRVLNHISWDRPAVLWLDDLQWGTESLAFAKWLLQGSVEASCPVLLVVTLQAEALAEDAVDLWDLDTLLESNRTEVVDIEPLGEQETRTLVEELLGLTGELAAQVEDRCGGNPLFAIQLVGDWVERGLLVPGPRGFGVLPGARLGLPDDLQSVWATRLERFLGDRSEGEVQALELAAILGEATDPLEWEAACSVLGISVPERLVELLLEHGLMVDSGPGGQRSPSFVHGMLRETLGSLAETAGRSHLNHRACATMLAGRDGPRLAERRARHLIAAGELEEVGDLLLEAVHERHFHGEQRHVAWLLSEREEVLERVQLPPEDPRWGDGWQLMARALQQSHKPEEAQSWAKRAIEAARQHGWTRILGFGLKRLMRSNLENGELGEVLRLGEEALQASLDCADPALEAIARYDIGWAYLRKGQLDEAMASMQEAQRCAEVGGDILEVGFTSMGMTVASLHGGKYVVGRRHATEGLAIFERLGCQRGIANAMNKLGELDRCEGKLEEAAEHYQYAAQLYERLGLEHEAVFPRLNLGLTLVQQGRPLEGAPALERALARFERDGRKLFISTLRGLLLPCDVARRDWATFDTRLAQTLEGLEQLEFSDMDVALSAFLAGKAAAELGERDRAIAALDLARSQWLQLSQAERAEEAAELIQQLEGASPD